VIAITNHNRTGAARLGSQLARGEGQPLILLGQEVTAPGFHLVAVGIQQDADWRQPAAAIVDAIHAQGGAAIAAHPTRSFWGYDAAALAKIDGVEAAPSSRTTRVRRAEVDAFFDRAAAHNPGVAPIGSSDFHFSGPIGFCRTYVFAREWSTRGVVDAIREGRTVAYDDRGATRGDRARVAIVERVRGAAAARGRMPEVWRHVSVALTLVGLMLLVIISSSIRRTRR
jgi:hypothetical protein